MKKSRDGYRHTDRGHFQQSFILDSYTDRGRILAQFRHLLRSARTDEFHLMTDETLPDMVVLHQF